MALPTYSALYAFGDSLSDAGNLSLTTQAGSSTTPSSPPYFQEKYGSLSGNIFSNGPTWVQDLSIALGLGTLKPTLAGGTDFAYGGAETGSTPPAGNDPTIQAISLPSQLNQFQTGVPKPSSTDLFTLSIGSNDLLDILANPLLTTAQQTLFVNNAVAAEVSFVKSLISDGAKNLLVLGVPDLGATPEVTQGIANGGKTTIAALTAEATQLSSAYDTALISQLGAVTGANIQIVNTAALIDNAIANPAVYGLTNVTDPVWTGNYTTPSSGGLVSQDPAAQDQYLFFDHLHPTETGHQQIAASAETLLGGTPVLIVQNTTTNQPVGVAGKPYTGPVAGLQQQYIDITADSLNMTATTPNWFLHSGSGQDALAVTGGTNVLDGGAGSNFLSGGTGTDTFFVDARGATATTWSTVNNFHAGDAVTLFGVTASDFTLSWSDGAGAAGYTGLTLTAMGKTAPEVLVTLAGFHQSDLTSGRVAISTGTDAGGGGYTYLKATA